MNFFLPQALTGYNCNDHISYQINDDLLFKLEYIDTSSAIINYWQPNDTEVLIEVLINGFFQI